MRRPPEPPPIYALADAAALAPMTLSEGVERLAVAGVRWIQLRAKDLPDAELYREVERSCKRLEGSEVSLWINDRADLAALFPVAGLHVGQSDLAPVEARQVVGDELWIGASTHSMEQLERAADEPQVDVVAVGPVFATASKADAEPVALEESEPLRAECQHFIDCVNKGKTPSLVTAEDAVVSIEIAEAEALSVETGEVVKL